MAMLQPEDRRLTVSSAPNTACKLMSEGLPKLRLPTSKIGVIPPHLTAQPRGSNDTLAVKTFWQT